MSGSTPQQEKLKLADNLSINSLFYRRQSSPSISTRSLNKLSSIYFLNNKCSPAKVSPEKYREKNNNSLFSQYCNSDIDSIPEGYAESVIDIEVRTSKESTIYYDNDDNNNNNNHERNNIHTNNNNDNNNDNDNVYDI